MARLSKDALLSASDIRQEEVDLPSIGGSVLVQGLSAAYSNEAQSEALEMVTSGREQIARVNTQKLENLQVLHGFVDPKFDSLAEVEAWMKKNGPAAKTAVAKIDELSGIDKEAIVEAKAKFPSGGEDVGGADVGNGTPARGAGPAVSS